MFLAGADLLAQVQAVTQQMSGLSSAEPAGGCHCAAVAEVPKRAARLVRSAVLADRRAGASWAQIGVALDISGEAARARFGRTRGSQHPPPGNTERDGTGSASLPLRVQAGS
ncbi:hypothetical protein ACIF80_32385 [Streptomyces sp. NPDC085927]|uniref:hypothetical protein n=1 Tax=Streptomyces sp. NPDC085927 TaxID=3365738 RepID=UPI0037D597AC